MKDLVFQYLEGTITPQDETALLAFLEQSAANRSLFRKWEEEWASVENATPAVEQAWKNLEQAIDAKAAAELSAAQKPRRKLSAWIASAAAALLLLIGTAALTWQFAHNEKERFYTCAAPYGSKIKMILPDNSVVWLNSGSTLRYSTLFSKNNRRVEIEGQAYFEVAKQDGAEFIVSTRGYDVVVKGTRFDVSAYNDDNFVSTALLQGSVVIRHGEDRINMEPGDMVMLDMTTSRLFKDKSSMETIAWMDNRLDFDAITLGSLAKILSRHYAVNVHMSSTKLSQTKVSISLNNKETIDEVLDALKRVAPVKVVRQDKEIYIR